MTDEIDENVWNLTKWIRAYTTFVDHVRKNYAESVPKSARENRTVVGDLIIRAYCRSLDLFPA